MVLLLGGCTGSADTTVAKAKVAYPRYVALGDSYTAAPYVPTTDVAGGCLRSNGNYPHLLAKLPNVGKLTDVSCSGADTGNVTQPQQIGGATVRPQDRALSRDTSLVTMGLGGNDERWYGRMMAQCFDRSKPCDLAGQQAELAAITTRTEARLVTTLGVVRKVAPKARMLLIGYPKFAPDSGSCPTLPRLDASGLAALNALNLDLNKAMAGAAAKAGVEFIDVYAASIGHDICAKTPWVNGVVTDTNRAAALHPFAAEQQAIAKLVARQLKNPALTPAG